MFAFHAPVQSYGRLPFFAIEMFYGAISKSVMDNDCRTTSIAGFLRQVLVATRTVLLLALHFRCLRYSDSSYLQFAFY
jgi:hypothetical protein